MSPHVHERLRELENEVRDLQVPPAADIRARGRSRGRRQLAALTVAGAVVATTAGIAFTWPEQRTVPAGDRPASNCVIALPDSPAEVEIRVTGNGAPAGLLDTTVTQLRARGFTVLSGKVDPSPANSIILSYGPAAVGAASLLRAVVHGEVSMRFDPDRHDNTVNLLLGPTFTRLNTTTEINQNLAAAGEPSAPPGC